MNKFGVVCKQVIRKNIKSPTYIVLLLMPVILLGTIVGIAAIKNHTSETPQIAIVSNNAPLRSALLKSNTKKAYNVSKSITTKKAAETNLAKEKLDGYLTVTVKGGQVSAIYKSRTNGKTVDTTSLQNSLNSLKMQQTAAQLGLSAKQLASLFAPANFKTQSVSYTNGKETAQKDNQQAVNSILAMVVTILIYIFMVSYASLIAQEVATEKGSRIMEILVSSVSPQIQFFAKVTGMFVLILLQVLVTAICGVFGLKYLSGNVQFLKDLDLSHVQPNIIIILVLFFILGITLYTILAAGLGALVSRSDQVSQAVSPLTMVGLAAYGASFVAMNSNTVLIKIGSFIPFLSQSIMPVRYAVGNATIMDAIISLVILAVSIVLVTWFTTRLYANHVLDYSDQKIWKRILKRN
ncbi:MULTISPECIES: ABC transporter permease [Pediococcus]|uniref:ABC transporter permease n=1 Tax=Pediococcus TaxID=1253 RepID=UPI000E881CC2|nr:MULTISPECIES: ABC transporter permease [Pediococcus]MCT3029780.1 ABC transporter permease [Pediococcus parvulus]HBO47148.1 ABC transporter permease [Pediococcus sp.]